MQVHPCGRFLYFYISHCWVDSVLYVNIYSKTSIRNICSILLFMFFCWKKGLEYSDLIMQIISVSRSQSSSGVRRWNIGSHMPHIVLTTSWQQMWCTPILTWKSWWTPLTTCARKTHRSCGPCAFVWTQRTALWIAFGSTSTWSRSMTSRVWVSNCSEPGGRTGGARAK